MKVKIKNLHNDALKLTDWNVVIQPQAVVELDVSEVQLDMIKNTPNLEVINEGD